MTAASAPGTSIAVVKIGGSVLTGPSGYRSAARFVASRVAEEPGVRLLVVVSAEHGETDRLLDSARAACACPDRAMLDLLWSTGELRSVALVTLSLQALGIDASGVNVHQTGLLLDTGCTAATARPVVRPLRLLERLAAHDVVVAPGFLARGNGDAMASLGRGGSDLTAVLLAVGLTASRCELVKDVPGYFASDPKRDRAARHLPTIDHATALEMAANGCELVQANALESAARYGLPLVVRSLSGERKTVIAVEPTRNDQKGPDDGVCNAHNSLGTAVGAGHRLARRPDFPDLDLRADGARRASGV
jgi:aspartate kinase